MVQINSKINSGLKFQSTKKTDSIAKEENVGKQTKKYQVNFEIQGNTQIQTPNNNTGNTILEKHYKSEEELNRAFKNGELKAGDTWDKFGPNGDKIGTGTVSYVDPDGRYWW